MSQCLVSSNCCVNTAIQHGRHCGKRVVPSADINVSNSNEQKDWMFFFFPCYSCFVIYYCHINCNKTILVSNHLVSLKGVYFQLNSFLCRAKWAESKKQVCHAPELRLKMTLLLAVQWSLSWGCPYCAIQMVHPVISYFLSISETFFFGYK